MTLVRRLASACVVVLTCYGLLGGRTAQADVFDPFLALLVDGGNNYAWQKVEVPGTKCGNGSQYKFFVHQTSSPNVLLFFEGGGACWDYDSCSGRLGMLGAANPNGIADDYMTRTQTKYVSPIVNGADPGFPFRGRTDLPTRGWNIVYMPYCTGDVHIGNRVSSYADPTGAQPPLTWHHLGFTNTTAAIEHAHARWPSIGKLLVTGYSAGGTATSAAYWFARTRLNPAKGYLINDSGPIFFTPTASSPSVPLHATIRAAWGLDPIFSALPSGFDAENFGSINRVVAQAFPQDQISFLGYSQDYNYSRFSYERLLTPNDKQSVLGYWLEDVDNLADELRTIPNASLMLSWNRPLNDSHCSTIITFIGSHACQNMLKKRKWWEYLEWPLGQTWKCYGDQVDMSEFLDGFINQNKVLRVQEPENYYNKEDPGMKILVGIFDLAMLP